MAVNIDKIEKMRDKERSLAEQYKKQSEQHKKKADDLDNQISLINGAKIIKTVAPYDLTGEEFDSFLAYLQSNKTVEAAIMQIKATKKKEGEKNLNEAEA